MRKTTLYEIDKLANIKMRRWAILSVCVIVLCSVGFALSASAAKGPTASIKPVIEDVTKLLNKPDLQGDTHRHQRRREIMKTIKRRFDFRAMCKRVLGRTWRGINEEEKEHFTEIMTKLLEYIYIGKLEGFHYKRIDYLNERVQGNRAQVSTLVEKKKVNLPVYYLLQLTPKGWMVYDINVEGVSLVRNYSEQFRSILRTNTFKGLVRIIEAKNKMLAKFNQNS